MYSILVKVFKIKAETLCLQPFFSVWRGGILLSADGCPFPPSRRGKGLGSSVEEVP
jgi:hypothetical protein